MPAALAEITVDTAARQVEFAGQRAACAIGWGGMLPAAAKREGDGATPGGSFPMRWLYYRPDRTGPPTTSLERRALEPAFAWCDAPDHADYNQPVLQPFAASHEALWRADEIYDLIVVIGHNDTPVVPHMGSAIFVHVARPDYAPTAGCVALTAPDLRAMLAYCGGDTRLLIY